jgi:hypothetical protein
MSVARGSFFAGRRFSLAKAKMPVLCEVRSKTESPCRRSAVVEMRGVAFCGPCAREQEAYFAIGELTQEEDETQVSDGKSLVEGLKRLRRERAGGTENIPAATYDRLRGVDETEPLALTKG